MLSPFPQAVVSNLWANQPQPWTTQSIRPRGKRRNGVIMFCLSCFFCCYAVAFYHTHNDDHSHPTTDQVQGVHTYLPPPFPPLLTYRLLFSLAASCPLWTPDMRSFQVISESSFVPCGGLPPSILLLQPHLYQTVLHHQHRDSLNITLHTSLHA